MHHSEHLQVNGFVVGLASTAVRAASSGTDRQQTASAALIPIAARSLRHRRAP